MPVFLLNLLLFCLLILFMAVVTVSASETDIKELINLLNNNEWQVRRDTALELGEIGEKAKEAVPNLVELLEDDKKCCVNSCSQGSYQYWRTCSSSFD